MAHASVLCLTLVGLNIVFALFTARSRRFERWIQGVPVVLVEHGRPLRDVMRYARIADEDVLAAAHAPGPRAHGPDPPRPARADGPHLVIPESS